MLQTLKLLKHGMVNIKELQKAPPPFARCYSHFRQNHAWLFFAEDIFSDLIEDRSNVQPELFKSIMKARQSKKLTSLSQVKKKYGYNFVFTDEAMKDLMIWIKVLSRIIKKDKLVCKAGQPIRFRQTFAIRCHRQYRFRIGDYRVILIVTKRYQNFKSGT